MQASGETWKRCNKCGLITNSAKSRCECGGSLVVDPSASPANPKLSGLWDKLAAVTAEIADARETISVINSDPELVASQQKVKEWNEKRVAKFLEIQSKTLDEIRQEEKKCQERKRDA